MISVYHPYVCGWLDVLRAYYLSLYVFNYTVVVRMQISLLYLILPLSLSPPLPAVPFCPLALFVTILFILLFCCSLSPFLLLLLLLLLLFHPLARPYIRTNTHSFHSSNCCWFITYSSDCFHRLYYFVMCEEGLSSSCLFMIFMSILVVLFLLLLLLRSLWTSYRIYAMHVCVCVVFVVFCIV